MSMTLISSAFEAGGEIPRRFTCQGQDLSPALAWGDAPAETKSFALIVDDHDAPDPARPRMTWVHWLLYNVPPSQRELPEGVEPSATLASGARQGTNDFGRIGYGGPCPPPGPAHRYFFRLYALDTTVDLAPKAKRQALDRAMNGHVLATAELVGRYQRARRR